MSMPSLIKQFDAMSRDQILALSPGVWGDEQIWPVKDYFEMKKKDSGRAMAVADLILRSPQVCDVDYTILYLDLIEYCSWEGDSSAALRWAHALIVFNEQHEDGINRANYVRELAEAYFSAGDLDTGLALFTRLMRASPGDIWNYNSLGYELPRTGLPGLAVEVLDLALAIAAKNDTRGLRKQLADQRGNVGKMLAGTPDHSAVVSPEILSDFRDALRLPVPPQKSKTYQPEKASPYLAPITRLRGVGPKGDAALDAEILAQGKVLIPELIRLAFDQDLLRSGAPAQAVRLLRQIRDAQAAELGGISAWLDQANGDWHNELLTQHFGKIGGCTTSELEATVADVQNNNTTRIYAMEALAERVKHLPALRPGYIAFIRRILTRREADTAGEENVVGHLIGDALDLDARELYPEIVRAFVEDRVDTQVISPQDVKKRWGLLPGPKPERREDGLYLRLRCTACDRVREHFVQDVLFDLGTQALEEESSAAYDPYIMDHEVVCPKCGAVDRYAMTPMAYLSTVMQGKKPGNLADLITGKKGTADISPNPRVHPVHSNVFGQPMHPLAGLEEYRRRIKAKPLDAKLFMRMGTLLRTLYRNSAALEAHRQAYALNPNDAEIALVRALSEHDFGDQAEAQHMYEQVIILEQKGKDMWMPEGPYASAAVEGLALLKRHKPSGWCLPSVDNQAGKEKIMPRTSQPPPVPSRKRHPPKGR